MKTIAVPSLGSSAFSNPTLYHAPLYVRAELYYDFAFDDKWYQFINIKKYVEEAEETSANKAYFLMNEDGASYIVYDAVNDKLAVREGVQDVDEANLNDNWTVINEGGNQYLYNMGAEKFAVRDNSEIGFTLVDGTSPLAPASTMNKVMGTGVQKSVLFVENGSLSASEKANDMVVGINDVLSDENASDEIYTLQGVKVKGGNIPAGIYIVNGKKVMIK